MLATVFLASWFSWFVAGLLLIVSVLVGGLLWAVFSARDEPFARLTQLAQLVKGDPPAKTPDGVVSTGCGNITELSRPGWRGETEGAWHSRVPEEVSEGNG